MKKDFYRNNNKNFAILCRSGYWYEGGIMYSDCEKDAMRGTKRQMEILLNKKQYQAKIRGARVAQICKSKTQFNVVDKPSLV